MKITQTSHHYYPHTGGTERVVKILVDGLVDLNNEVHVFSDAEDLKKADEREGVINHGISLKHIGKFRFPERDYWKKIENTESDIVHVQGQRVWSSDYLYRKLDKIHAKKVFTAHGFYQLTFGGKTNQIYYHRFMPSYLAKFNRIVSLTEHEASITRSLAPTCSHRITVIPDPVDTNLMGTCMKEDSSALPETLTPGQYILHSGGLHRNKNIEDILASMVGRKSELVLTGNLPDPSYWHFLRDMASKKGVRMTHLGDVDNCTLYTLMRNCSHYISPSKFESFGMSMVEAAYVGSSVIAYDNGVAGELAEMGLLKIVKTPEDIGNAIDTFRRKDNIEESRGKLKEKYDSKKVVNRLNALYEEIMNE